MSRCGHAAFGFVPHHGRVRSPAHCGQCIVSRASQMCSRNRHSTSSRVGDHEDRLENLVNGIESGTRRYKLVRLAARKESGKGSSSWRATEHAGPSRSRAATWAAAGGSASVEQARTVMEKFAAARGVGGDVSATSSSWASLEAAHRPALHSGR
jgi:hypothetical protein